MHSTRGVVSALLAFVLWGLFPIYWKLLKDVPALQVLGHRVIWSAAVLAVLAGIRGQWRSIVQATQDLAVVLRFVCSSLLIAINWLGFIWGVSNGYVVECSLGYFILPLFSVFLGVVFLKESLRPLQLLAVAIAGTGVGYATIGYGDFPWIAITLACSFSLYALLRKTASIGSLPGLTLETAVLLLPALLYLLYEDLQGRGVFLRFSSTTDLLLSLSGIATAVPLLLYADAARRLRLSTLGILNYLAPLGQFLLGVFYYHEEFTRMHAVMFGSVWLALGIFSLEGLLVARQRGLLLQASPDP